MINHIVLLRCHDDIDPVIKTLEDFCNEFDGAIAFKWGVNGSIEPHVMHGFNRGFVITFENAEARDRYVNDPGHKAIGKQLVSFCTHGADDIVVFDMAIGDSRS